MIHVNIRGLAVRGKTGERQLLIQLRQRQGEPEVYELPGGRINEYEQMTDALKREIQEETGLRVIAVWGQEKKIVTSGSGGTNSFAMECVKPYAAYQTLAGPVDSFGVYFVCEVEGELIVEGDDTADVHWADREELTRLVQKKQFSEIDLPALLMYLREEQVK